LASVFAYGGSGVAVVTRAKPRHDITALRRAIETSDRVVSALGFGTGVIRIIETDDPDQLRAMLDAAPRGVATPKPAGFVPRGAKRGGLESTCPEKVISIEPRLDFQAWNSPQRVLKEEEPFNCIACGKPFGTKSSIDRVLAKLGEKHWMFQGANAKRLDVIKMCADCRVEA